MQEVDADADFMAVALGGMIWVNRAYFTPLDVGSRAPDYPSRTLAGEPMNVLVNGTLIAQGEVVVVNDKFGIRLTDIITPAERMRKLGR